jgi:hypothetical protein
MRHLALQNGAELARLSKDELFCFSPLKHHLYVSFFSSKSVPFRALLYLVWRIVLTWPGQFTRFYLFSFLLFPNAILVNTLVSLRVEVLAAGAEELEFGGTAAQV